MPELLMRIFIILVMTLSVMALGACSSASDDSGQARRGQSGAYISGGSGLGF